MIVKKGKFLKAGSLNPNRTSDQSDTSDKSDVRFGFIEPALINSYFVAHLYASNYGILVHLSQIFKSYAVELGYEV